MKHLLVCSEYPDEQMAPGGIGTYSQNISRLLAEAGETVHVISKYWSEHSKRLEEKCDGRLVIHRLPGEDPRLFEAQPGLATNEILNLLQSAYPQRCFSLLAKDWIEKLVKEEGIDIIESQDYEAPLYEFQSNRARNQGPARRPPCIVHLHSPTEFIVRHNDWDPKKENFRMATVLEDYSIKQADGLLCPSRYLAHQAQHHYSLAPDSVSVIPYPLGDYSVLPRADQTWEKGSVLYVGRLEIRKGILEWIQAAIAVARDHPEASFDFVGADILSLYIKDERKAQDYIPENFKDRFRFHGSQNRSAISHYLQNARIAAVPSRWENFPHTCMEAMRSGIPVIATQEGGMGEMIQDGRSGWLAASGVEGLSAALRRALETSPQTLSRMGHNASMDVNDLCNNTKIIETHLDFRAQWIRGGARTEYSQPPPLPREKQIRISSIICTRNRVDYLGKAVESLIAQSLPKDEYEVIVVDNGSTDSTKDFLNRFSGQTNFRYIHEPRVGLSFARNTGWQNAKGTYVAFLDDDAVAHPTWLKTILKVFETVEPQPGCVGGKTQAIWEAARPNWLDDWLLHGLALTDWSSTPRELPNLNSEWLVGTNMAFPVQVLKETKGFVTGLDRSGTKMLSSGDVFLEKQIQKHGLSCFYHPDISVEHRVPLSRLNQKWFIQRYYWQGVSDAAMEILEKNPSWIQRIKTATKKARMLLNLTKWKILLIPTKEPKRFRKKCFTYIELGHIAGILTQRKS